ncbi:MAG: hypothetical protein K9L70_12615 [Thiohalocapsa sp.]|nr:hypothetical protein [Thiohalocapsa sp.]MCF7992554.1 hypothetical protein [Thiohalocapsa sp.]
MTARIIFWRLLLLAAAGFLGWLIIGYGLAAYYAERLAQGDEAAAEHALTWQPNNARALLAKGRQSLPDDPQTALGLLQRAYRANPTEPAPLILMAGHHFEQGDVGHSDRLISFAAELDPADPAVQRAVAAYWAERGDTEKMLAHWSTVLRADRSAREDLFPLLVKLAESPDLRQQLEPLIQEPPSWWNDFFGYLTRESLDLETVRDVYALRRRAVAVPLTDDERGDYVRRLQKEGLISEAYLTWIKGLDNVERGHLGLLYNGGFELPPSNQGFDWRIFPDRHFAASPAATYGASDSKALRLQFRAFEGRFWRLGQPLFLDTGNYRMAGRMRLDSLKSKGGVRWQVICEQPERIVLGEGPRLLGSGDWSEFDFTFPVPAGCTYQQLRLVSAGWRDFELKLSGVLWFDDLEITRVQELDAASQAAALLRTGQNAGARSDIGQIGGD